MKKKLVLVSASLGVAGLCGWLFLSGSAEVPPNGMSIDSGDGSLPGPISDLVLLDHGSLEPRSDWAAKLFERIQGSATYSPRSSPKAVSRPFDDSDPEMLELVGQAYAVGGCASPGQPCEPAAEALKKGGDRLARYLILQFERSLAEGYPDRVTYLSLIAYTESQTAFDYIAQRIEDRASLSVEDQRTAVFALSRTGHPDAIAVAQQIVENENDQGLQRAAFVTFSRVPIATGVLPPDLLDYLKAAERGDLFDGEMRILAQQNLLRLSEHFEIEWP